MLRFEGRRIELNIISYIKRHLRETIDERREAERNDFNCAYREVKGQLSSFQQINYQPRKLQ